MKKNLIVTCAGLAIAILSTAQCSAADRAQTSEMPAAFAAMGMDSSRVLTRTEAGQVRGEGGGLLILAGAKANVNVNAAASVHVGGIAHVHAAAKVKANVHVGAGLFAGIH